MTPRAEPVLPAWIPCDARPRSMRLHTVLFAAGGALSLACNTGNAGGAGAVGEPGTVPPTFSNVYLKVFLGGGCLQDPCHGSEAAGNMSLRPRATAYANLVGVDASGHCGPVGDGGTDANAPCGCFASGLERVKKGDPEHSLIVLKLSGSAPCGDPMPRNADPIAEDVQSLLKSWIRAGAPDD